MVEVPLGVVVSVEAVTVSVKLQVPVPPFGSEVVPLALCDPTPKVPLVVTTPLEETSKLGVPLVFTYVTEPVFPEVENTVV